MAEENIALRLKNLISELGINSSIFADNCGISRATLSQLLTGRNKKISDVLIGQIHKAYPNLSILWLLFNEGDRWNKEGLTSVETEDCINELATNDSEKNLSDKVTENKSNQNVKTENQETGNFASDNLKFASDCPRDENYGKEIGLNPDEKANKFPNSQELTSLIKNTELLKEIEFLRSKIKKVVQITIYYDDSTFESFYPK